MLRHRVSDVHHGFQETPFIEGSGLPRRQSSNSLLVLAWSVLKIDGRNCRCSSRNYRPWYLVSQDRYVHMAEQQCMYSMLQLHSQTSYPTDLYRKIHTFFDPLKQSMRHSTTECAGLACVEATRRSLNICGGCESKCVGVVVSLGKECTMCTYLLVMRVRGSLVDLMYRCS